MAQMYQGRLCACRTLVMRQKMSDCSILLDTISVLQARELAECTFKPKIRAIPAQVYHIEHMEPQEDSRSEAGYSEHYVAVM